MDSSELAVALGLNGISGLCGLSVVLMVLVFSRTQRSIISRVSLRLQTGISLIDFVKHFLFFFSYKGDDSFACSFLGFLMMSLEQMYLFLNVAIALNLHLVIINDYSPRPGWEYFYWGVPSFLVAALNIPLLALRIYGKSNSGTCLINNGTKLNNTLEMVYFNIPSMITILYCIIISVIVVLRLRENSYISRKLPPLFDPKLSPAREEAVTGIRSLVRRSTFYPAACFLSNIGINAHVMYDYVHGSPSTVLRAWGALGYSSAGILNLIAFLSDPLVWNNLKVLSPYSKINPNPVNLKFDAGLSLNSPDIDPGLDHSENEELLQAFVRFT